MWGFSPSFLGRENRCRTILIKRTLVHLYPKRMGKLELRESSSRAWDVKRPYETIQKILLRGTFLNDDLTDSSSLSSSPFPAVQFQPSVGLGEQV